MIAARWLLPGLLALGAGLPAAAQEPRGDDAPSAFERLALEDLGGAEVWREVEPPLTDGDSAGVGEQATRADPGTVAASASVGRQLPPRAGSAGREADATPDAPAPGVPHWSRSLLSLAGVVGLILLLAWGYRMVMGERISGLGRGRRPGVIEVVSRTTVAPRQSLCLVRVGPRMVLVGISSDGMRSLDVIDDPALAAQLAGDAEGARTGSSGDGFRGVLAGEASAYKSTDDRAPAAEPSARSRGARREVDAALRVVRDAASRLGLSA